ncbi:hypothetical protein CANARDRAFT_68322 [[Candida] arabinofermentans NRRL YB-2248]|uniref:Uncharacterized protein n=1 Tax=[Candida] arabinofermentans NRRL YB-2248 TaxID=983967 RepID=A0A1E4SXF4_9ASCO|nr:hypothetical protein CANARDRAFT_68322 [[Candida] arabinofermentans NRRL YB-2248]
MALSSPDHDVDRFLYNFQELDSARQLENNSRLSTLEREVQLKRQQYELSPNKKKLPPLVPSKDRSLRSITTSSGKKEQDEIFLVHPVAKKSTDLAATSRQSRLDSELSRLAEELTLNSQHDTSTRNSREPKAIKYDDVMQPVIRKDLMFGRYSVKSKPVDQESSDDEDSKSLNYYSQEKAKVSIPLDLRNHSPTPKSKIGGVSSSKSSTNYDYNYIPMPSNINVISATAAAKSPPLLRNTADSSLDKLASSEPDYSKSKLSASTNGSQGSTNYGYIPMPSRINVISASAAAKAPPLMKNTMDSSLGEKSFDLSQNAKLLVSGGASSRTYSPSPKKSTFDTASLKPTLDVASKKPKPLIPPKSNIIAKKTSLSATAVASDEIGQLKLSPVKKTPAKVIQSTTISPELSDMRLSLNKPRSITKMEPETPEALSISENLKHPNIAKKPPPPKPEALSKLGLLKPTGRVEKTVDQAPLEALAQRSALHKAKPIPRKVSDKPEALLKLSALRSSSPTKASIPPPSSKLTRDDSGSSYSPPSRAHTAPNSAMGFALPGLAQPERFFKLSSNASSPSLGLDSSTTIANPKRPKTLDNSDLDKEGQKLKHLTKGRAKGPKRRGKNTSNSELNGEIEIPAVVESEEVAIKQEPHVESTPAVKKYGEISNKTNVAEAVAALAAARNRRKVAPPIRKSSRKVSTSELFL